MPFAGYQEALSVLKLATNDLQYMMMNEIFRISSLCRALIFSESGISGQRWTINKENR